MNNRILTIVNRLSNLIVNKLIYKIIMLPKIFPTQIKVSKDHIPIRINQLI